MKLDGAAESTSLPSTPERSRTRFADVQASHITYARERDTGLGVGAIINLAYRCLPVHGVRRRTTSWTRACAVRTRAPIAAEHTCGRPSNVLPHTPKPTRFRPTHRWFSWLTSAPVAEHEVRPTFPSVTHHSWPSSSTDHSGREFPLLLALVPNGPLWTRVTSVPPFTVGLRPERTILDESSLYCWLSSSTDQSRRVSPEISRKALFPRRNTANGRISSNLVRSGRITVGFVLVGPFGTTLIFKDFPNSGSRRSWGSLRFACKLLI